MIFRITNDDIFRSSTLDKTDWNKYAVVSNGCIHVCGNKQDAESFLNIIKGLQNYNNGIFRKNKDYKKGIRIFNESGKGGKYNVVE